MAGAGAAPMHIPAHQLPLPMERLAGDAMHADDDDAGPRLGSGSISHSDAAVSDSGDQDSGSRRHRNSVSGQHHGMLQPQGGQQQQPFLQHQAFAHQQDSVMQQQHDAWRDMSGGFEQHSMRQQHQAAQQQLTEHEQHLQQLHQQQQQQEQQQQRPVPPQPPPDPLPNKADLVNMRCEIWCAALQPWRSVCFLFGCLNGDHPPALQIIWQLHCVSVARASTQTISVRQEQSLALMQYHVTLRTILLLKHRGTRPACRREQEQRMVHGIVLSYNQESDLHQAR